MKKLISAIVILFCMATMSYATTYGFCADTANPRTPTGKVTLTSYIWEYLGNQMPVEIYGIQPEKPAAPMRLRIR